MRVSKNSIPNKVAGAIAGIIRSGEDVELKTIGAAALNQAVKSAIIAGHFLETDGKEIVMCPSFDVTMIDGAERTAIIFKVSGVEK